MDIFSVSPNIYKSVGILNILILLTYIDSVSILMLITKPWAFCKDRNRKRMFGKIHSIQYYSIMENYDVK